MATYSGKVPYDADPRPLAPANPNLKAVREGDGPSPTQDGPRRGTGPAVDDMSYLDTSGEMYAYLGHFRKEKFLEEGHNVTVPAAGRGPSRRTAPARSQGSVTGTSRPVAGRRY